MCIVKVETSDFTGLNTQKPHKTLVHQNPFQAHAWL